LPPDGAIRHGRRRLSPNLSRAIRINPRQDVLRHMEHPHYAH
jgi:hypothetical protein